MNSQKILESEQITHLLEQIRESLSNCMVNSENQRVSVKSAKSEKEYEQSMTCTYTDSDKHPGTETINDLPNNLPLDTAEEQVGNTVKKYKFNQ
jgi:hypothetical protein